MSKIIKYFQKLNRLKKTEMTEIQNLFENPQMKIFQDKKNENDYLQLCEETEKFRDLLFKYRIGIKKDDAALRKKIANRCGLEITKKYEDDNN